MKLPAFFGKKGSINLLPKDSFEASTLGVVLQWALAAGKWTVIVTQLVVMGAFLWRFGLDRRLTNLRKEIAQQVAVIKSYEQIEEDFTLAQKRVLAASEVMKNQEEMAGLVDLIESLMPVDVWLERLSISTTNVSLSAKSGSLLGFSRFLAAIQNQDKFKTVSVGSIEDGGGDGAQFSFEMTMSYDPVGGEK